MIEQLKEMGFRSVKFYETFGKEVYYDARLPNGKRIEIMIDDGTVYWRYLREDKINLNWNKKGKLNIKEK